MAAPTDAAGASAAERDDPALPTARVWDVFVRVFLGYAIAILVALRIVWGFVGTR